MQKILPNEERCRYITRLPAYDLSVTLRNDDFEEITIKTEQIDAYHFEYVCPSGYKLVGVSATADSRKGINDVSD